MKTVVAFVCLLIMILVIRNPGGQTEVPTLIEKGISTIPSQILQWYDSDIIAGERPSCIILENKDTWDLPSPIETDWFTLDSINVTLLSEPQIQNLQNWIFSGANVCIVSPEQLSSILPALFKISVIKLTKDYDFYLNVNHPVNTDIALERLHLSYEYVISRPLGMQSVIVSRDETFREVLAGVLRYGKGYIYFNSLSSTGNPNYTQSRFYLNLQQWLAAKDVPILTLKDVKKGVVLARIGLKDKKVIFGKVFNPT